jgi:hypothetical protein
MGIQAIILKILYCKYVTNWRKVCQWLYNRLVVQSSYLLIVTRIFFVVCVVTFLSPSGERWGLAVWAMVLSCEFDSRVQLKTRWFRRTTRWQKKQKTIKIAKSGKSHQKIMFLYKNKNIFQPTIFQLPSIWIGIYRLRVRVCLLIWKIQLLEQGDLLVRIFFSFWCFCTILLFYSIILNLSII